MKTRVLILDQASNNVGMTIIELDDGQPRWKTVSLLKIKGNNLIARISQLYDFVNETIKNEAIDILVLEDVPLQKKGNTKTMAALLKVLGSMEMAAFKNKIPVEVMNVLHWKNLAGIKQGNRVAQKQDSIQLALGRWRNYADLIIGSDDIADVLNMSLAWLRYKGYISEKSIKVLDKKYQV